MSTRQRATATGGEGRGSILPRRGAEEGDLASLRRAKTAILGEESKSRGISSLSRCLEALLYPLSCVNLVVLPVSSERLLAPFFPCPPFPFPFFPRLRDVRGGERAEGQGPIVGHSWRCDRLKNVRFGLSPATWSRCLPEEDETDETKPETRKQPARGPRLLQRKKDNRFSVPRGWWFVLLLVLQLWLLFRAVQAQEDLYCSSMTSAW